MKYNIHAIEAIRSHRQQQTCARYKAQAKKNIKEGREKKTTKIHFNIELRPIRFTYLQQQIAVRFSLNKRWVQSNG